jgi:hypothetical protein
MRCGICCRPDAKEINLQLLQRSGRRTGVLTAMAQRLGVCRQTIWRHRRDHLRIFTSKKPGETKELSFEERARLLANETDKLQCQLENGLPGKQFEEAMRALTLRTKLLELESRFAGRPMTQKADPTISLEDPGELARAKADYHELYGPEAEQL